MRNESIDRLNGLLKDEVSAIETYSEAQTRARSERVREVLVLCQIQHQRRAQKLTERIAALGGKPTYNGHPWGAVIKLIAANVFGFDVKLAIGVLEEGEDVGLIFYKDALKKLDSESVKLIETELLPGQAFTREIIHDLLGRLDGSSALNSNSNSKLGKNVKRAQR
jgi:hypothetical protein